MSKIAICGRFISLEGVFVISYLTTQLATKSQNASVNQNSRNIDIKKEPRISNSNKVNDVTVEICNEKLKNVVIIGDSMLNNIKGKGLSKSKKVDMTVVTL